MIKKLFFLGIVLSAFLCACTTEDTGGGNNVDTQQPMALAFDNYLGRASTGTTRSSITDNTSLGAAGIGIYARYTKDSMYMVNKTAENYFSVGDIGSDDYNKHLNTPVTDIFQANFMNNIKLYSDNGTWTYRPTHYWPSTGSEFLTFIAYGPYDNNTKLYTKTKTGEGTAADSTYAEGGKNPIYYKYDINDTSKGMYDLVWNYNNTWNLQMYLPTGMDRSAWSISNYYGTNNTGDGDRISGRWNPNDTEHTYKYEWEQTNNYRCVRLKMAHACARLAFVVSCPALSTTDNYIDIPEGKDSVWSGAQITVDTVWVMGKIPQSGYLNLANNTTISNDPNTTSWENLDTSYEGSMVFPFYKFSEGEFDENSSSNLMWKPNNTESNLIKGVKTKGSDGKNTITVNTIGNSDNEYLYIIPPGQKQFYYCYVAWTVNYRDGTTGNVAKEGLHYSALGITERINFEAGKSYVLNLKIGQSDGGSKVEPLSNFNALHFTVNTDDWGNESPVRVYGNWTTGGQQF